MLKKKVEITLLIRVHLEAAGFRLLTIMNDWATFHDANGSEVECMDARVCFAAILEEIDFSEGLKFSSNWLIDLLFRRRK